MDIEDLEEGDKLIVNDRDNSLRVEKKLTPIADRKKIHLKVKGSGKFYAEKVILLSGVQDGKYHIYEDVTGDLFISRSYSPKTRHDQSKSINKITKVN